MYDTIIVGGGPAGLSAALVLGRCRRHVLLCDAGHPRNEASRSLNGYLTRDGVAPCELLRLGREELKRYAIELRQVTVTAVTCVDRGFSVSLEEGVQLQARTVLLATGVRDHLPAIPGFQECYGNTVHHCPYCDGWESRNTRLVVFGRGQAVAGLALSLKTWSTHVTICTSGALRLSRKHSAQLAREGIAIRNAAVARLEHEAGAARRIVLANGERIECDHVFFTTGQSVQSELARNLGCELTRRGVVKTDHLGRTRVSGLYVVGDASRDVQFAIVAAAEGAKAGVAINKALQAQDGLAVESAA